MSGTRGDTLTLAPELASLFATLRRLPAYEQVVAARRLLAELDGAAKLLREVRLEGIRELRDGAGLTFDEIADLCGMSFGGVHDVYTGRRPFTKYVRAAQRAAQGAEAPRGDDLPGPLPAQPPRGARRPPTGP